MSCKSSVTVTANTTTTAITTTITVPTLSSLPVHPHQVHPGTARSHTRTHTPDGGRDPAGVRP
ncbi:hypothetical protein E2C01_034384 [Portunus trituberculatus]|uniref:Uncharacterized protein n=1 Tax=Portunus trituberculatus TaxID=210409 RepID=A0A5B7F5E6_PORTR|nr:hypothetical protein [Portunus trituberculatus]